MKYKYFSTIIICVTVLIILIGSILTPDQQVSEIEGRKLELIPLPAFIREMFNNNVTNEKEDEISTDVVDMNSTKITEEQSEGGENSDNLSTPPLNENNIKTYVMGILNGDYFNRWDTYFSDHILGRNIFVNLYSFIQKSLKKEYINGVYFGDDGYLFTLPDYIPLTDNEVQQRVNYYNKFAQKYKNSHIYAINLPNKYTVYEDKLPINDYKSPLKGEFSRLAQGFSNDIEVLDLEKVFSDSKSYFLKTDHHWNMEGVYQGYINIIDKIREQFPEIPIAYDSNEFEIEEYERCFIGSDGRRVVRLVEESDNVMIWTHELFNEISVEIDNRESQFYHYSNLEGGVGKHCYGVYMNGDNGIEVITNPNVNNDLSLALIGDSMSNPLIPLLSLHFKSIYSYDMRHYQNNLLDELNSLNPDIIMLISLTPNFMDENSEIFDFE